MLKKILNFIYSKRDEGIYCYITILGIKIVTKPLRLQIEKKLNDMENKINNSFNELYPFIFDRNNEMHKRFDDIYPFICDRLGEVHKRFDELYPFLEQRYSDVHTRFNQLYPFWEERLKDVHTRFDQLYPFMLDRTNDINKKIDNLYPFINDRFLYTDSNVNDIKDRNLVYLYGHFFEMYQYMIENEDEFNKNIEDFKIGLDNYGLEVLNTYLMQIKSFVNKKICGRHFYKIDNTMSHFFTNEQRVVWLNRDRIMKFINDKYSKKYDINDILPSLHVNYYELGIVYLPDSIKKRFSNSIAIDCGTWIGDSAIMLYEEYDFKEIHCFEPIKRIFNKLKNNVDKYRLYDRIKIHNYAVSNKNEKTYMLDDDAGSTIIDSNIDEAEIVESITLDKYLENKENISLIKFDIEGFEEQGLLGAENIIIKYNPVLLISCYHDYVSLGQMFRIKKYIEKLNLGYKILFRGLTPDCNYEYNLICYTETRPDQTRPDQTRPDQTRPDQTRPNYYICNDCIYF
uniref:FkbM family methyltransferase n=1 Tax=uncultured Brachyspira sp. TaxID=221953 RepID=UPI00262B9C7E